MRRSWTRATAICAVLACSLPIAIAATHAEAQGYYDDIMQREKASWARRDQDLQGALNSIDRQTQQAIAKGQAARAACAAGNANACLYLDQRPSRSGRDSAGPSLSTSQDLADYYARKREAERQRRTKCFGANILDGNSAVASYSNCR